jgi:4-hydroxy-tetrahydrodipicolinate reductase
MDPIKIMVNGLPGNMASKVASFAAEDVRFRLIPRSLTGPEISTDAHRAGAATVRLIAPSDREQEIAEIIDAEGAFISVDYTHPSAANDNARFYCRHRLPFVMGTTGGNRSALEKTVFESNTAAVIAPNMAKQIVGFQAMMEHAADSFPDLFKGYRLEVRESHQKGKADTSGTARAMIGCFNRLGIPFSANDIRMERDPEVQLRQWGVPEDDLRGHAWHTYTLISLDGTVRFEFTHNVNGRDIYARGTLDAVEFLHRRIAEGSAGGKVYTMLDVLMSRD